VWTRGTLPRSNLPRQAAVTAPFGGARRPYDLGMVESAHVVNIPPARHLADELRTLSVLARPELIAGLRQLRTRELEAIGRHQREHLGELTGQDVCTHITALVDAVVLALVERAAAKSAAPVGWQDEVGVFAVGGYGRGEMNPFSDLDLLVLSAGKVQPAWLPALWSELQTSLWDVKFQVGASQRSASELAHILDEDFVTATAVIEQRPLAAGAPVRAALGALLGRFRERRATPFLRYKLDELAKRRTSAGASVLLMEPNLKSNPGCLRDVQLLRNVAFAIGGSRNILALADLESITRQDLHGVIATNDHLLALRSLQHFHHGRKQDVWQLADQVRIAQLMGYSDVSRLRAVEHLMRHHYNQVLHVHQMVDLVASRLHAKGHLGRKPVLLRSRKVLTPDFTAIQGQVHLADPHLWEQPDAALRLLRGCREAQRAGARLSFELQRAIRGNLEVVDDAVRHHPEAARLFLAMLGDAGRIQPILTDMHRSGLLGAYLPEFGTLTCLMQFDSWHQYTVDEHTLIAIGHLDAVARGERGFGLPGMGRIFPGLARKDLLALGLLLHDMGKYMGRGHVARGAIMITEVAHRLGLSREEEDLVYFLVERHVVLSDASRTRNFREPSYLNPFAERIGSLANLDALYCLTYCDAKAVGEGVLTGWQEALLGELYEAVAGRLAGAAPPASHHDRLVAELVKHGAARAEAEAFLAQLGGTYDHQVQPAEALRHLRALAEQQRDGVGLGWDLGERFIQITAAVPDRHGLLADVAATFSGHGFDIIDARSWITEPPGGGTGVVLYSFRMSSIYPSRLQEEDLWRKLRRDLLAVSQGALDPRVLLERRRQSIGMAKPADSGFDDPAVKVENHTSDHYTVLDVHTKDEVGLLSRLCRAISDHGCDIGYACINTMGDVAVDVFYVRRGTAKLDDGEAEDLRRHLVGALGLKRA
jgi:[protein-PII] uridylyltransferase